MNPFDEPEEETKELKCDIYKARNTSVASDQLPFNKEASIEDPVSDKADDDADEEDKEEDDDVLEDSD